MCFYRKMYFFSAVSVATDRVVDLIDISFKSNRIKSNPNQIHPNQIQIKFNPNQIHPNQIKSKSNQSKSNPNTTEIIN